jgi:hypothetical protein
VTTLLNVVGALMTIALALMVISGALMLATWCWRRIIYWRWRGR